VRFARIAIPLLALVTQSCGRSTPAEVLLFNGTGASVNDVRALEDLLRDRGIDYEKADSGELDAMNPAQLREHRLLIVPGGNFEEMGNHLKPATSANIRSAVRGGLNYLGICGGAFMAGNSPYNGINLTDGVRFRFYAISSQGVRKAAVPISTPDGPVFEHYWEDGPELSGWGAVIAKYPDGTPAVAQGRVGQGWVVLAGTHPEAPENWREGMTFATPASEANAYASRLIDAALRGASLSAF
jgi:glutamine amidotransferase-like uncharacterized protein